MWSSAFIKMNILTLQGPVHLFVLAYMIQLKIIFHWRFMQYVLWWSEFIVLFTNTLKPGKTSPADNWQLKPLQQVGPEAGTPINDWNVAVLILASSNL